MANAKKIKLDLTQCASTRHTNCNHLANLATKDNSRRCLPQENKRLRAILNEKYSRPVETVEVYTCKINNTKETSRLLREINEIYCLDELKHLKRIKNDGGQLKVIICALKDAPSNATTLKELFSGTRVDINGLSEPSVEAVPKHQPLTRQQFEKSSKIWPTGFHEDKYLTKLINGEIFDEMELEEMEGYMRQALDVALVGKSKGMVPVGAVIVNPKTKQTLCTAHDMSSEHPLQHAAMVCIDLVGRLQGGGAWDTGERFTGEGRLVDSEEGHCSTLEDKHGGSRLDKNNGDYDTTEQNICCQKRDSLFSNNLSQESNDDKTELTFDSDVPYLCTGYDLYITREPCVMCSMALLHSRIRRVFYAQEFAAFGGLGSKYKIHCLEETNHHFEVFSGLLETECRHLFT